ncbi:unnamed protein product [Rhizophagus irregularis]|nr:unnamed protein product [Rhizophagus irregularis]CAB5394015.1 unnamed protein product [Rhizophagus irregularis]
MCDESRDDNDELLTKGINAERNDFDQCDYLVIQVTSVPSKQMFSVAKFTINLTRNRLNPDKVHASLCLKTWFAAGLIEEDFMRDNDLINE